MSVGRGEPGTQVGSSPSRAASPGFWPHELRAQLIALQSPQILLNHEPTNGLQKRLDSEVGVGEDKTEEIA
jgi:hypothetical protein